MSNQTILDIADEVLQHTDNYAASNRKAMGYLFDANELLAFAEKIIELCGYHADVFAALGCPDDMDPTEAKPSDYIKKNLVTGA